jgi:hypothetical protein
MQLERKRAPAQVCFSSKTPGSSSIGSRCLGAIGLVKTGKGRNEAAGWPAGQKKAIYTDGFSANSEAEASMIEPRTREEGRGIT